VFSILGIMMKILGVFGLVALLALPVAALPQHASNIVKTQQGFVQGFKADGVRKFRGIPFAKPPVGDLRWQEPRDPDPYHCGLLKANTFGHACMQASLANFAPGVTLDEDCL
jgi:para-nitrobenzyl esterase